IDCTEVRYSTRAIHIDQPGPPLAGQCLAQGHPVMFQMRQLTRPGRHHQKPLHLLVLTTLIDEQLPPAAIAHGEKPRTIMEDQYIFRLEHVELRPVICIFGYGPHDDQSSASSANIAERSTPS